MEKDEEAKKDREKALARARWKRYKAKNSEKVAEKDRCYYEKNRSAIREKRRQRYEERKEAEQARSRAYRAKKKGEI